MKCRTAWWPRAPFSTNIELSRRWRGRLPEENSFMLTGHRCCQLTGLALVCLFASSLASAQGPSPLHRGYYTAPAIHGDTVVFTSEGDLWTVGAQGGIAHRLTSDPGTESSPVISPDGKTVVFSGESEGP